MGVHDRLEPVEIEKEKAQVRVRLLTCLELEAELAVEKAVVAQAREIIAPRDLAVMIGIGEIQKRIRGVAREHLEQAQMPLRETFVVGPVEKTDDSAGGAFDQNRHREDGSRRVGRALVDRGEKKRSFWASLIRVARPSRKTRPVIPSLTGRRLPMIWSARLPKTAT